MTEMRRLLPLFALVALLIAPFGRIGMAQAAVAPHHDMPMAMAGHCADMPASAPDRPDPQAIDCMIACAAIAPANEPLLAETRPTTLPPGPGPLATFHGILAGTDPPPPRNA